jgi:hypothetical protein
VKLQQFRYRDTANLELEIYGYTGYNWSHWDGKGKLKEKSGSYSRKRIDRFTRADSCTWNSTHNTERAAM